IREAVEMGRDVSITASRPPQTIDSQTGHFKESDFFHCRWPGNVVDAEPGPEFLAIRDAVCKRVLEVTAHVVVGLHGDNVCAIGKKKETLGDLQMVCTRVITAGEESDRLEAPGI